MIPAPAGMYAMYLNEEGCDSEYLEVIAFSDDGLPMVVSPDGGSLIAAHDYGSPRCSEFYGVSRNYGCSPGKNRYTSIVPGGEWLVDIEIEDGTVTRPVDFWATTETGEIEPVIIDTDGINWNVRDADKRKRIYRAEKTPQSRVSADQNLIVPASEIGSADADTAA
jgi:hypothetical protein